MSIKKVLNYQIPMPEGLEMFMDFLLFLSLFAFAIILPLPLTGSFNDVVLNVNASDTRVVFYCFSRALVFQFLDFLFF